MPQPDASKTTPLQIHRDRLAQLDWDFADAKPAGGVHAIHPYPAKFIPMLPRRLIEELSEPGQVVLDPFSGGGTTAVEAAASGRPFIGIDANPVANLIARVKTTPSSRHTDSQLRALVERLEDAGLQVAGDVWLPEIPNLHKWYDDDVFAELGQLRQIVHQEVTDSVALDRAMLAFITTANRMSFQESETRYVSAPRPIAPDSVRTTFLKDFGRMSALLAEGVPVKAPVRLFDGDARSPDAFADISPNVSLVVTSPPYPNSYDYHLYHRFRLFWLGHGPKVLRDLEIGSHLKNQSDADPIGTYLSDMSLVLKNLQGILRPGGSVAMIVGSGVHKGEEFDTAEALASLASDLGYEAFDVIHRALPSSRRSVTSAGRRLSAEQILLLSAPRGSDCVVVQSPDYDMFPYERQLQMREALSLSGGAQVIEYPGGLAVSDGDAISLRRMAFAHHVGSGESRVETYQRLAESLSGRKKDSTYASHGIHRYKGKFYPQLAKALMNASSDGVGLVLDPFGGSGTVAAEAVLTGRTAWSVDQNPLAVATARAKVDLLTADPTSIRASLVNLRTGVGTLRSFSGSLEGVFPGDVDAEIASWFPERVARKMASYLTFVRSLPDARMTNIAEVLLSDCVREISQQEPRDLRIRRRKEPIDDADVFGLVAARIGRLLDRIDDYHLRLLPEIDRLGSATVVLGNSAEPDEGVLPEAVGAVVSSPPYGTALPYIDTDRLSLAAIFGKSAKARRAIEQVMVGSREIGTTDRRSWERVLRDSPDDLALPDSTINFLLRYSEAVAADDGAGFRKQQAPLVLARYFTAMRATLASVCPRLVPDADVWLVLGDSRSTVGGKKWTIPTIAEVASIGELCGLSLVEELPITVTREDRVHAKNFIAHNSILHFVARPE